MMIFYLVPAAAGRPAMLQPTQADANREARERSLKVRAPDMEHNVPTDKAGLMAYINGLLDQGQPEDEQQVVTADEGNDEHVPVAPPAPAPVSKQLAPAVLTQLDVEEAIQGAELPALASYASNVAWRFSELGKAARNG